MYNNRLLALRVFAVAISGVIADIICAWLAWFLYKNAPQVTEPHAENLIALSELNRELSDSDDEKALINDPETGTVEQCGDLS